MKYLALALSVVSIGALADTGTSTSTETINSIRNTNAPNFIAPLTMGGGDVLPFYSTLSATSVTCPSNQFILEAVNTNSGLRGSGAPKIGNYGTAVAAKVVIPFGDDGKCGRLGDIIVNSAKLEESRSKHNLCMGEMASFKAEDPDVYLTDNFFNDNEGYKKCRGIFVLFKIAHKQQ